jgi:hypothetical protein
LVVDARLGELYFPISNHTKAVRNNLPQHHLGFIRWSAAYCGNNGELLLRLLRYRPFLKITLGLLPTVAALLEDVLMVFAAGRGVVCTLDVARQDVEMGTVEVYMVVGMVLVEERVQDVPRLAVLMLLIGDSGASWSW